MLKLARATLVQGQSEEGRLKARVRRDSRLEVPLGPYVSYVGS